jgi:hypothetical protein
MLKSICPGATKRYRMPKFTDHRPKLDKATVQRHFPEWDHGGKGHHRRRSNKSQRAAFESNYEQINWSKK